MWTRHELDELIKEGDFSPLHHGHISPKDAWDVLYYIQDHTDKYTCRSHLLVRPEPPGKMALLTQTSWTWTCMGMEVDVPLEPTWIAMVRGMLHYVHEHLPSWQGAPKDEQGVQHILMYIQEMLAKVYVPDPYIRDESLKDPFCQELRGVLNAIRVETLSPPGYGYGNLGDLLWINMQHAQQGTFSLLKGIPSKDPSYPGFWTNFVEDAATTTFLDHEVTRHRLNDMRLRG
jgi:hypothetical protein